MHCKLHFHYTERMSNIRKLFDGIEKKYIAKTFFTPLVMVVEVILEVFIPFLFSKIIDNGVADRNIPYIVKTGLLMVFISLASLCSGCFGSYFAAGASQGLSHHLRNRLFAKVQSFSFSNIDKFSTASLVTRLTTDVTMCQNTFQMIIKSCARSPIMLIAGTVMAFNINKSLSFLFFISIPILLVAVLGLSSLAYPRFSDLMKKYDTLNASVQENLIGIRIVKAFVREKFEEEKFTKACDAVRKAQVHAEKVIIFLMPVMQLVMYLSIAAVVWFGGHKVIFGTMLPGQLVSFFTYVMQILMSLMMLGMVFVSTVMVRASIKRICEVLDEEPSIVSPENAVKQVKNGSIEFCNVNFSYTAEKANCVLENINLKIQSGQTVGIIGGTGSSKTTLVSLVPRLYDCLEGCVKVGGEDVRNYDLEVLRDSVSMVLQKNVLFTGTIRENLLWGNENATEEQIVQACKAADADSFIRSFSLGYDTVLGQGGVNVSGGQKQRLCIARALLKNPKILILDDSTSAVDTATEARIRTALKQLAPETTKIIIAQRISSVKDADIIFVMEDGKINGCGTHSWLLENNEIYREVFESQQQGSGDADLS